ncbi:MAG: twin-arginine translocase subunit TatC [Opitutales bacterium]|nr:twin-arginine translocase subunit TatC [Opitutales bacterium]
MAENENGEISLTAANSAESADARGEMSFFEHLEELRSTLIACIAAFVGAGTLSLVFSKQIFALLRLPLEWANVPAGEDQALVVMRFMDTFSILLYIALLGGIVLAGPFVLYRFGKFVAPALTRAERSRLIPFCAAASGLFLTGAALAFFWLAPVSIRLPYWLAEQFGLQMNWLAQDYYLFVVALTLFSGLMFEFPLVVVFLQYAEMVSKEALLEKWRWVLSGILVAGVLISPIGDPVVLLVFSGVLFALFLAAVYVGAFLLKRKIAREESVF